MTDTICKTCAKVKKEKKDGVTIYTCVPVDCTVWETPNKRNLDKVFECTGYERRDNAI